MERLTYLHPARAEFHVGVAVEAAGLNAEVGDTGDTEGQGLSDAEVHVAPLGVGLMLLSVSYIEYSVIWYGSHHHPNVQHIGQYRRTLTCLPSACLVVGAL